MFTSKNEFRTRYFRLLTDFEVAYIAKWFISDMNNFLTHLFQRGQNVLQSLKVIDQAIIVTLTMEAIFQGLSLIKSLNLFYLSNHFRGAWRFEPNTWYTIEERVKLNTPGQLDGSLFLFVNNELKIELHDLNFREVPDIQPLALKLMKASCLSVFS